MSAFRPVAFLASLTLLAPSTLAAHGLHDAGVTVALHDLLHAAEWGAVAVCVLWAARTVLRRRGGRV